MNVAHLARAPHRAVARRRRHLIELYLAEKERDQGAGPLLQVDLAGVAGALLGSIRRECLNHMIVFGEADLRRSLGAYAAYYNESRTHRFMNKDAPYYRAIERLGAITSHQILGGLHHQYCRIKFFGTHRYSQSSKRCCERPRSEPSKQHGCVSEPCSMPSRHRSAPTTPETPDTLQRRWIRL